MLEGLCQKPWMEKSIHCGDLLESQTMDYSWSYGQISPAILSKEKTQCIIFDSSRRVRMKHGFVQPLHKVHVDNLQPSQPACSRHSFSSYRLTVCLNCLFHSTGFFYAPVFISVIAEKFLAIHWPSYCQLLFKNIHWVCRGTLDTAYMTCVLYIFIWMFASKLA